MATRRPALDNVDPALLSRIAELSPGSQRWLKTAIITMSSMPVPAQETPQPEARQVEPRRASPPPIEPPEHLRKRPKSRTQKRPPDMEDIITGKVDSKELDNYPELAEQLEGMGDVIDLLRGLGASRRRRGEEILRDEILGSQSDEEDTQTEDDEDFNF